jgi:hypothetical protein
MTFYLIDLISQVYAVEVLLAKRSERDILEWLKTKGELKERKTLSSEFRKVYEFRSKFELCSHIYFNTVFWLEKGQFIFISDHTTFRPCQHSKLN